MVRSWSTSFGTSGRSSDEGLECTWTSWAIWEGSKGTVTAVSASGLRIHSGSVNNTFHFANKDEKGSLGNMIQKSDTHGSVCFRRNRHMNNTCFSGLEHSFQGMSSKEKTPYICKAMCRNKKSILKNWKLNEEMYRMYDEVGVYPHNQKYWIAMDDIVLCGDTKDTTACDWGKEPESWPRSNRNPWLEKRKPQIQDKSCLTIQDL